MSGATKNRLSHEDVQNILAEVKAGATKTVVAKKYGIDHSLIYHYLKKAGILIERKKSAWASKEDYDREYRKKNKKKLLKYSYEYRNTKKFSKKIKGKSYKELLMIENEKRKAKGLYLFKTPTAGFYK